MATESNKKNVQASAKVTRIKAKDTVSAEVKEKVTVAPESVKTTSEGKKPNALKRFGGYFKGAWQELKLVRWPTRKATWGLTGAVLVYSAAFVIMILLLDVLFKYLFELILV